MRNKRFLYIYDKLSYEKYSRQRKEEGYDIYSITSFLNKNTSPEITSNTIIDITALKDAQQLQFESVLLELSDEATYICENIDNAKYIFRHCFDEFLNMDTEETFSYTPNTRVKCIVNLDAKELESFWKTFDGRLCGHDKFKDEFKQLVNTFKVFNRLGEHKILSLFLMGDSGIGKTEVARSIHKALKSRQKLAKINFGNYSSTGALNSLIGSPRGYIGSEDGELFMKVKSSDIGLILIDEFEKGDSLVYNYFLDVLESGKMTNSLGEEIDLDGYIIVFTSNISKDDFALKISPELRSRFDYKGVFNLLTDIDKIQFVRERFNIILNKYRKEYGTILPYNAQSQLEKMIEVRKYNNMREINSKVKECFVKYLEENSFFN